MYLFHSVLMLIVIVVMIDGDVDECIFPACGQRSWRRLARDYLRLTQWPTQSRSNHYHHDDNEITMLTSNKLMLLWHAGTPGEDQRAQKLILEPPHIQVIWMSFWQKSNIQEMLPSGFSVTGLRSPSLVVIQGYWKKRGNEQASQHVHHVIIFVFFWLLVNSHWRFRILSILNCFVSQTQKPLKVVIRVIFIFKNYIWQTAIKSVKLKEILEKTGRWTAVQYSGLLSLHDFFFSVDGFLGRIQSNKCLSQLCSININQPVFHRFSGNLPLVR